MGSVRLPQAQLSEITPPKKRDPQTELILQVLGNNPLAQGINQAAPDIADALAQRAQMRRQTQQASLVAKAGGIDTGTGITDPAIIEKLIAIKNAKEAKQAEAAKQRTSLEFELEKLRQGYSETNPATGQTKNYPGAQGLSIKYDEAGNPFISRSEDYQPKTIPKSTGGGQSSRGSTQQTTYADSSDGVPLFFDREAQRFIRSDGQPVRGVPVPAKGNADAVQSSGRAAALQPTIESYRSDVQNQGELSRRASLSPIIGPLFYPEITQKVNELKQAGFAFGGKNYTGTEAKIIEGAMVPGSLDSKESAIKKMDIIEKYTTRQITLLDAANLLGPAGKQIKDILNSSAGEKKATMRWNPRTGKVEPIQ